MRWETAAPPEQPSPVAERRQLTVMFCDLVESTVLAGQLDPEDFRDVVLHYQTTCTVIIERYGGHMAQYLGDGLLVYFGYPYAHEDDAQRAIHAGLEILTALADLNHRLAQPFGIRLEARLGIHTGLVVVGEVGGGPQHGQLALGVTPNIAARLQAMAAHEPVLFIVEDLHWIDPSTLEWLGLLIDQGPTTRVLTFMTCRPTFQNPWGGRAHVTSLTINRLLPQQVAQMARTIAGADVLPAPLLDQIVAQTDGVRCLWKK